MTDLQVQSLATQRYRDLLFDDMSSKSGLMRETGFIRGLEQPGSKTTMIIERRTDDVACRRVVWGVRRSFSKHEDAY